MAGFHDIVGQESVVTHFKNAIKLKKISHAYILNGEKGMGKKTVARAFSMTLQCEEKGENPCLKCRSCKQSLSKNNPDIKWIEHEKPGVISVDEVREQINGDISIKPYSNEYKIYIVDDAEKMNVAAQNAILKTIEEPPSYAIIIFLTENKNMLLSTILSRCVTMEFKPVRKDILENYLVENCRIVDYKAREVSAFAGGNIGKAIKYASNDDFLEMKDSVIHLAKNIKNMTVSDMSETIKEIANYKDRIQEYFDLLILWYRDLLVYKASNNDRMIVFKDNMTAVKDNAKEADYQGINQVLLEIENIKWKMKVNVNFDLLLELLLIKMRDCLINYNGV